MNDLNKGNFVILYNNGEYEIFNGELQEAIEYVKVNRRYSNYNHNGATIIAYTIRYSIKDEAVETVFY
jgi:hypothetical protein